MLATLVPSIHKTAELVQKISAASTEQSVGAEHVNTAMQQLDQVTQQNSATSEEIATTAEELDAQARQLQHTMAFFKIHATAASRVDAEAQLPEPMRAGIPDEPVEQNTAGNTDKVVDDDGYRLALNHKEPPGDERDEEFKRY